MAGEKNPLFIIGEALKRFAENPAMRKGKPISADRQASRGEAANRLIESIQKETREWVKKAISKDAEQREEAKKLEKDRTYASRNIKEARRELEEAQQEKVGKKRISNINRTPDIFERNSQKITVPEVAQFTAAISNLPQELQTDPNIIYHEVGRLYRSFDWKNATPEERFKVRKTIDTGIQYAKKLALQQAAGSEISAVIIEDKTNVDYRLNLGVSDEEPFDLYRSRPVAKKEMPANKASAKYTEALQHNRQADALGALLKNTQNELDGSRTREIEMEILENTRRELREGIRQKNFTEEQAGKYRDLATARWEELRAVQAQESVGQGQVYRRGERRSSIRVAPRLTSDEQDDVKNNIPSGLHDLADRVFELYDRTDITREELEALRSEFNKKFGDVNSKDAYIKSKISRGLNPHDQIEVGREQYGQYKKYEEKLAAIIDDKLRPFANLSGYERAYFGMHPEDLLYIQTLKPPQNIHAKDDPMMRRLFDIAQGICDRATDNPRAQFREGMDLYTSDNWKEFISTLREQAQKAGWDPGRVEEFTNLFTGLREMRELVHDLQFAGNFAGLEILQKMVGNTLAGDLDAWIYYTPGMRFSLATYMTTIRNVTGQNNGWIPPELFDPSSIHATLVDKLCYAQMEEALKSGRIAELADVSAIYQTDRQRALEIMMRNYKVAKAFGTITLSVPTMLAEAKIPRKFISGPENNLIQDMDWWRHGIFKYGLGKFGRARFYASVTHDDDGAHRLLSMTEDQVEKFFYEAEQHPEWGKSISEFRNFFKMADRFGDGNSFWGMVMGMKEWSQELRDVRGAGIKLNDAIIRASNEVRSAAIDAHFGPGASETVSSKIETWWSAHMHDKAVHDKLHHTIEHHVNSALEELFNKLPGEVLDRATLDVGYERLRCDAIQQALSSTKPHLLEKILKKNGSNLEITNGGKVTKIESLWDLSNAYTGNNPTDMHVGIPRDQLVDLQQRLNLFSEISYQMAGDLSLIQQVAVEKYWLGAEGKAGGIQFRESDMKSDMLDRHIDETLTTKAGLSETTQIEAADRRQLVRAYIQAIHKVTETGFEDQYKHQRISYKEYLRQKFIDGREHNVFTKIDVPINRIQYANWGSSVLSRTIGDAYQVSLGSKGFWKYMEMLDGSPDKDAINRTISEDIIKPLTNADPGLARNIGGFSRDAEFFLYRETDLATNLGFFGRALTSELAIHGAEFVFNLPVVKDIRELPGIKEQFSQGIPRVMWGSRAQKLIAPGAKRMTASDIWSEIHDAENDGQLPTTHHPFRWGESSYFQEYTAQALRGRYHGNIINIIPQIFMMGAPLAGTLVIVQALKEEIEKKHGD